MVKDELAAATWFKCNLGDAMLAEEMLVEIKKSFACEYRKNNRPKDMALFIRHESEGRLHCEVNVYFPPAARTIADAFGAVPCSIPSPDNLGLLVGERPGPLHFQLPRI